MASPEKVKAANEADVDSMLQEEQARMQEKEMRHRMEEAARVLSYFQGLEKLGIAEDSVQRFAESVPLEKLEGAQRGLEVIIAAKRRLAEKPKHTTVVEQMEKLD